MKKLFLIACFFLTTVHLSFGQVPVVDSLKGTYVGMRHVKVLSTDPWTIVTGTFVVTWVDTFNCSVTIGQCGSQSMPLSSSYTYCPSSNPVNYFITFHNMDSITVIADSNTIQPPCGSAFSARFYGKRINNNTGMGISEIKNTVLLSVYPNPSNTVLFIEYKMLVGEAELQITDVIGKEIKNVIMNNQKIQIDISSLENGAYFVNLKTDKEIIGKKIMIAR